MKRLPLQCSFPFVPSKQPPRAPNPQSAHQLAAALVAKLHSSALIP